MKKLLIYREYWEVVDEVDELRKGNGACGTIELCLEDNYDTFYYGFPIRKKAVKKMYETIKNKPALVRLVDFCRLFNDREELEEIIDNTELLETINAGLDECPCPIYNGLTPKEYKKEKGKAKKVEAKFDRIPQNNAHLDQKSADLFYKLYFAVLEYTNDLYNLTNIKKIYKQERIDAQKLVPINNYLWEHKEIIDEFIKENKYNLTKEELEIVKDFKKSVTSNFFIIVGFEKEYTKILSEDGKLYMVKGVRCNFDEIIESNRLPVIISTTLMQFKDNIIYNSFFSEASISFGSDIKLSILDTIEKAIKYYHL